ncbi:hypothetical protein PACTADRAFT_2101 [Pachysolen tannophilus NRRL Y-2460]|uniref:Protein PNS1 n=1 Tax=Pachysolen tannophilus NRRL Y-2460 TaxID=669874 RepID=A0A1E4TVK8_PACTA|nr:hypothetical protein PACTADRAFT_2101 [Pachysolen tannophilus NRRL Y-2460]
MSQNASSPPPTYQPQPHPGYDQSSSHDSSNNTFNKQQQENDIERNDEKRPDGSFDTYKPQPSENFDDSFKVAKPWFNDWPFTILFTATLAGFICVAVITIKEYSENYGFQGSSIYNSGNDFSLNSNTIILFAFVIAISMVLSFLSILWARLSPRSYIITALICNVIFGIGTAIAYFVMHYYSAAIVFLVITLINIWCYWSMRSRIPFSCTVLTIIIDVMKWHPTTLLISVIGLIVSGMFSALFSVTVVATYIKYQPNSNNPSCTSGSCSKSKLIGILVFVFFAGYYISEVIKNVIHVTISGVYGTWYYLSKSDQGVPRFPALGAFRRAMTYSFGPICFGSLIVALVQLLKQFIQIMRQNAMNNNDMCGSITAVCFECIIYIVDWALRYFNQYAYSYVALYGKSYLRSAKDTWQILRYKGIDALCNDCLIGTSLSMISMFVAYVASLFAYLYLKCTKPEYNSDGGFYAPVVAYTFVVSMQISNITNSVIRSGVTTFFVALAKDPEVFMLSYRDKFDEVLQNYPNVLEKITADN